MAYSLLAHLYPHIREAQEDIATLSLQFLLEKSEDLNKAFTRKIADAMNVQVEDTLQYTCQDAGGSEDKGRPDMAGYNAVGNLEFLFEMKFYASLTENQPRSYLDRLIKEKGKGLMFVCPRDRRTVLWAELKKLCVSRDCKEISEFCIDVDGIKMSIMSWAEIIELLKLTAQSSNDTILIHDIVQLEGYCAQMDSEKFIPFNEEDLCAKAAIKAERYYRVVDETINLIATDKRVSEAKTTKLSSNQNGCERKITIDDFEIAITYERSLWKKETSIETPFWLGLFDRNGQQSENMKKVFNNIAKQEKEILWGKYIGLALRALEGASLEEVCTNLKEQIFDYINLVK